MSQDQLTQASKDATTSNSETSNIMHKNSPVRRYIVHKPHPTPRTPRRSPQGPGRQTDAQQSTIPHHTTSPSDPPEPPLHASLPYFSALACMKSRCSLTLRTPPSRTNLQDACGAKAGLEEYHLCFRVGVEGADGAICNAHAHAHAARCAPQVQGSLRHGYMHACGMVGSRYAGQASFDVWYGLD